MKAELRGLASADVKNLKDYQEKNKGESRIELTIEFGLIGGQRTDLIFSSLEKKEFPDEYPTKIYAKNGALYFSAPFDYGVLWAFLANRIGNAHGNSWQELAHSLSDIGRWEWIGKVYPPTE